ncbi:MAG: hypothetical protein LBT54_05650, partial [Bifidobacteriaceae bacterium]|nr:hypothetical protein [Bifidobacteriaceae bacterium]
MTSPEHVEVIQGLLADLLGLRVARGEIFIVSPYSITAVRRGARHGGAAELELRQTLEDVAILVGGRDLLVEFQVAVNKVFAKRGQYYACGTHRSRHASGPEPGASRLSGVLQHGNRARGGRALPGRGCQA